METEIINILNTIEPRLWFMAAKIAVAIVLALIAKGFLENIAAYVLFRFNDDLNKRGRVRINGDPGTITGYNRQFIYIKLDDGFIRAIPVNRWKWYTWDVIDVMDKDEGNS